MGIKNFTSFITENFTEWDSLDLSSLECLVIDGKSVCCKLYSANHIWSLGGDYKDFKQTAFFFLLSLRVKKLIVIFDGVDHDCSKLDTVRQRRANTNAVMKNRQDRIRNLAEEKHDQVLPSMIFPVFMDALENFNIEYRVADGDADEEIAAFANYYKCPVLASDSDYFMFELNYGYIPFDRFMINEKSLYHVRKFEEQFSLKSPELRLAIPALYGNDFIKPKETGNDFSVALKKFSKYDSFEQYFTTQKGDDILRKNFEIAKKQYCDFKMPADYDPQGDTPASSEIFPHLPEWVIKRFRKGCFEPELLNMHKNHLYVLPRVIEDIKQSSAWLISGPIRQYLYGFMGIPAGTEVTEAIRAKSSIEVVEAVVCCKNFECEVSIQHLPAVVQREDLVLTVLKCHKISKDDIIAHFNTLDDKWKLPIAATFYWYQTCNDPPVQRNLVKSLLLSFLVCSDLLEDELPPLEEVTRESRPDYLKALHAFAQWQCVYHDATSLNYLADEPFLTTNPASLYSGRVAMFCAFLAHSNSSVNSFISDMTAWNLFNKFLYLVTGRDEEGRSGRHDKHKRKSRSQHPVQRETQSVTHANRFDLLSDSTG